MRCNPLRWLWGLIPLAMLGFVAYLLLPRAIEDDLATRSKQALLQDKLEWAGVSFVGRDATVSGRAADEDQQRRAAMVVAKVAGVRRVVDRTTVTEVVKSYTWSARVRNRVVTLAGHVPSEAVRKAIMGTAKATFPAAYRISDTMKVARGVPDANHWLGGVTFALKQLSLLNNGGSVELDGLALTASGEGSSPANYATVKTALARGLPTGLSIKEDSVVAPVVDPYSWAARHTGRTLEITGHTPSDRQRAQILEAARAAFPGSSVADRMAMARGEPSGWQSLVVSALSATGKLKQGRAELVGRRLTVTGYAPSEQALADVRGMLKSATPTGFRFEDKIELDPAIASRLEAERQEAARRAQQEQERREAEERRRREAAAEEARRNAEARRSAEIAAAAIAKRDAEERERLGAADRARREAEAREKRQQEELAQTRRREDAERRRLAAQEQARQEEQRRSEAARLQAEAERRRIEEVRLLQAQQQQRLAAAQKLQSEAKTCQSELTAAMQADTINFERASATLDRDSRSTLAKIARIMRACPKAKIEIGGHTDAEGIAERKQRLSVRRANAVAEFLTAAGVSQDRLSAAGYADSKPVADNETAAGRAKNRRIEFVVKSFE